MASAGAAVNGGQGGADVDLQAAENISKDTLVAIAKRKDKENKEIKTKLSKLEEQFVKRTRFNKILMEDRQSFLRFCNELLPESDAAFEEAAVQEVPINLEALLRRLGSWRGAFEAVNEDRKVFRQFVELVFPNDEAVVQLFERPSLGPESFNMLQYRWIALEDLHNQSIASINNMVRQQMIELTRKLEEAVAAKKEVEQRCEEMRTQLTQMAKEKAQMLTRRLQGGDSPDGEAPAAPPPRPPASTSSALLPSTGPGEAARLLQEERLRSEIREARDARDAATRRIVAVEEAASQREQDLRTELEGAQGEARRLREELERIREEGERHRVHARQLLEQKDEVLDKLQSRLGDLEQEMGSNAFIERYAEQQASRDADTKAQQRRYDQLAATLTEIQRLLGMSYSQERVLKERIRELEQSQSRGFVDSDYLKHVILKYVEYTQKGDLKAKTLVPAVCTVLRLTPEERRTVERASVIPQPLLFLNQAVGEASLWFRGEDAAPTKARDPMQGLLEVESPHGSAAASNTL
eukprot:gnl/TRDRNA2_/TRDRNA2_35939_c0_seq1.p1 gnl/TRDRNA2_/TRDRNA2_35939_c0~~gnl/TRDRNA2_/TRDRNA2_35939_c0_seq1.p1  ORF type:complete len:525 (+),score=150.71 gnl/TRDRNA2_/TRDRNA2_35939_c0_seq1:74-1648(+)